METDALQRLHYAAAIGCGVFAALAVHIVLSVFGIDLGRVFYAVNTPAALAWWIVAGAAFVCGWAVAAYLIAARRERQVLTRIAQRVLIALIFIVATGGGIFSRSGELSGTAGVIAGVAALGIGLVCAYCGARVAYLNAEQF